MGVVGGAGHVGLPLGIVLADAGFEVTLIDKDETKLETIRSGTLPYRESGGEELFSEVLEADRLSTTTDLERVRDCSAIFVVVGTPIDEHHNPQMDPLLSLVDELVEYLSPGQLVSFRSTLYPRTTTNVRGRLTNAGFEVGDDI